MEVANKPSFISNLLCAILVPLLVFVTGPATIYWTNISNFSGTFVETFVFLFVIFAICFVVLVLLLSILTIEATSLLQLLFLYLALVFFIQSNFLVRDYGLLDGSIIKFEGKSLYFFILEEIVIYSIIFTIGFLLRWRIVKSISFIYCILICLSLILTIHYAVSSPDKDLGFRRESSFGARYEKIVEGSKTFNIFHVMLDSFQADALLELIEREKSLEKELKGFTFFVDNVGYSNWTTISMTAIFSGEEFFGDKYGATPIKERIRILMEAGFMKSLYDNGFKVKMIQPVPGFCQYFSFADACVALRGYQRKEKPRRESLFLLDLALFRCLPTLFKEVIYNEGKWFFHSLTDGEVREPFESIRFFKEYIDDIHVGDEEPAYHFIHVYPPHRPFVLNENCRYIPLSGKRKLIKWDEMSWERYLQQAQCSLLTLLEFFEKLKSLGVYESSLIIFQADTGLGQVLSENDGKDVNSNVIHDPIFGYDFSRIVSYANSVLMIKPPFADHDLKYSNVPSSHFNTGATVLKFAKVEAPNIDGKSVFELNLNENKPRKFVLSRATTKGARPFHKYEIHGAVGQPANWRDSGVFLAENEPMYNGPSVSSVSLKPSLPSPQKVGAQVTLTAEASGGSGNYEFLFEHKRPGKDEKWVVVQDWSRNNKWIWNTSGNEGNNSFFVYVRDVGSVAQYEERNFLGGYEIVRGENGQD